jgi:hypothetical protein
MSARNSGWTRLSPSSTIAGSMCLGVFAGHVRGEVGIGPHQDTEGEIGSEPHGGIEEEKNSQELGAFVAIGADLLFVGDILQAVASLRRRGASAMPGSHSAHGRGLRFFHPAASPLCPLVWLCVAWLTLDRSSKSTVLLVTLLTSAILAIVIVSGMRGDVLDLLQCEDRSCCTSRPVVVYGGRPASTRFSPRPASNRDYVRRRRLPLH